MICLFGIFTIAEEVGIGARGREQKRETETYFSSKKAEMSGAGLVQSLETEDSSGTLSDGIQGTQTIWSSPDFPCHHQGAGLEVEQMGHKLTL